uniref:Uncharacterized protein n=1 Tax=Anguilla anguilla TaxID=7936 RepID=A0A0E9W8F4_ANGAN
MRRKTIPFHLQQHEQSTSFLFQEVHTAGCHWGLHTNGFEQSRVSQG